MVIDLAFVFLASLGRVPWLYSYYRPWKRRNQKMYKVMIMDDEPWSRKVIIQLGEWDKLALTIIGEAEDGTQGLRMIAELTPDIVVTDMRMPGIDGVELLKALNDKHPLLKIIVMSGYDDFVYLKQAIQ